LENFNIKEDLEGMEVGLVRRRLKIV